MRRRGVSALLSRRRARREGTWSVPAVQAPEHPQTPSLKPPPPHANGADMPSAPKRLGGSCRASTCPVKCCWTNSAQMPRCTAEWALIRIRRSRHPSLAPTCLRMGSTRHTTAPAVSDGPPSATREEDRPWCASSHCPSARRRRLPPGRRGDDATAHSQKQEQRQQQQE